MKQNFTKYLMTLLVMATSWSFWTEANAQCSNNNTYYTDITPLGVGTANSNGVTCNYGGEYCTVSVIAGATYNFTTCGATFDTQITLFNGAGVTALGYDDDGSICGSGNSDLTWTATFTGTLRVLVDEYNCLTNSICAPLECTLVSMPVSCSNAVVAATQGACELGVPTVNLTFDYDGACSPDLLYFSTNGVNWFTLDLSGFFLSDGSTLNLTDATAGLTYYFYYLLDDGTESPITSLDVVSCGTVNCNEVDFYIQPDCFGNEVSWAIYDQNGALVYEAPTGTYSNTSDGASTFQTTLCLASGCYTFEIYDSFGDGLDATGSTSCTSIGDYYAYDAEGNLLFDGTPFYTTGLAYDFCVGSTGCSFLEQYAYYSACVNNLNEFEFVPYFTGGCEVAGLWLYSATNGWEYIDLTNFGFLSGESVFITNLLNNTLYDYQFELSDGSLTPLYSFFTESCGVIACGNAVLSTIDGDCLDVSGTQYYTTTLAFNYTGACGVSSIWWSIDGFNYNEIDVTLDGYASGDVAEYYFAPGTTYYVFYELSNGQTSNEVVFVTGDCASGEFICDCAGNQVPIEALVWLGDGFLDNGASYWNGIYPVDFDCQLWGFDCDDAATGITLDPFAVCYGNIPPANGCNVDACNGFGIDIYIDCYEGETSAQLVNEFGEVVYSFGTDFFTAPDQYVSQLMCLPTGCYTFTIFDSFGDGLNGQSCTTTGYYELYDENGTIYLGDGSSFTFSDSYTFCIGEQSCTNLNLAVDALPCFDYQGAGLLPSAELTFGFSGACEVADVYIAAEGEAFTPFDFSLDGIGSGESAVFYNLQPNTVYYFYYTLSDGTFSALYTYTTGDCSNEITICDCAGTQHTIGVTAWLGDGYADNGFYQWAGQNVDFNCATWGFDCGDVVGAPALDPYNVCGGGLPPFNGCEDNTEVLGCTDPTALNYNPDATINNGSCIYNSQFGCTDPEACNYLASAQFDNGSCEYVTCAGCTDESASNYDPNAIIDDGSCNYDPILGCTNADALNYNPVATTDDGSCIFNCQWPSIVYTPHCIDGVTGTYMITMTIGQLGNGSPYIVSNSYNQQQYTVNFIGSIEVGPFPNNEDVVITVVSGSLDACFITSPVISSDCTNGVIEGCTDAFATNFNPLANEDNGSCVYDFQICDCEGEQFSPATRFQLGNGQANNGAGNNPNFNCATWGYDCGDIVGAPNNDPYGVCSGNLPPMNGCDIHVGEVEVISTSVYPNPTNGILNIVSHGAYGMVQVRMLDQAGKVVENKQMVFGNGTTQTLDLSKFAAGTYQLEMIFGDHVEHKAIVVQR
ncbi:MAG: T9SS type A sorting domain-containing protein [Flavobacteriales bacterium]